MDGFKAFQSFVISHSRSISLFLSLILFSLSLSIALVGRVGKGVACTIFTARRGCRIESLRILHLKKYKFLNFELLLYLSLSLSLTLLYQILALIQLRKDICKLSLSLTFSYPLYLSFRTTTYTSSAYFIINIYKGCIFEIKFVFYLYTFVSLSLTPSLFLHLFLPSSPSLCFSLVQSMFYQYFTISFSFYLFSLLLPNKI